jgi:hypothetical protein
MNKSAFSCLIIFAIAIFIPTFAVAQTWNNQVVDNADDAGYNSRVAVTSNGVAPT